MPTQHNALPMKNPRTICVQCAHYYHGRCLASPLPRATSPVSGREMSYSVETDGRVSWHDSNGPQALDYHYCFEVNFGDCPKYEPKEKA